MRNLSFLLLLCFGVSSHLTFAQSLPEVELNQAWVNGIEEIAPEKLAFPSSKTHNVLLFSLHTGFKHWVIPHTETMLETIMKKVGGFEVTSVKDINYFHKDVLKRYDAVILNNNCSIGDHRDMFWDVLKNQPSLDSAAAMKLAKKLEKNLIKYVKKGGGLMAMHGGIVMQNKSKAFSEMMGGSFKYHPKQQEIEVKLTEPNHPLLGAFSSSSFTHIDEPYVFDVAYDKKDFKPLLYFEADKIVGLRNPEGDAIRYVSWIRKHGKGRVFYSSPSHNAQSFQNPELLQFFLNGLQFVVGDVECDTRPLGAN